MLSFIALLVVAGVCGSVGRAIGGGGRGGCLVSIALGFIGALAGLWLARELKLPMMFEVNLRGQNFPVVWSVIGSALFVATLNVLMGRRRN